jgi:hypothetical protein
MAHRCAGLCMQQSILPTESSQWWTSLEVPDGYRLSCELGPLCLDVYRGGDEWRLNWRYDDDMDLSPRREMALVAGMPDEIKERYVHGGGSGRIALRPTLMDRPVVIRPREPVFLPSGQETTLYLSTPLCLRIEVGEPASLLREIPMVRLSDTWFGPSTREGDMCYSARTHARHSLFDVPRRPHRAITPLLIQNHATSVLPLEKLSLPVPTLSVYGSDDGNLWTEGVSLVRASDTDLAALRIDNEPPRYARNATLISEPRQPAERGRLVRAFSVLFGS